MKLTDEEIDKRMQELKKTVETEGINPYTMKQRRVLPDVNNRDVAKLKALLISVADTFNTTNDALPILSKEVEWLVNHNIAALAQEMLNKSPEHRQNKDLLYAYVLVIHFLETFTKGLSEIHSASQNLLKELLLVSKQSETNLLHFLRKNIDKANSSQF
jgi:hypothetical protein